MEKINRQLRQVIQSLKGYLENERCAGIAEFYLPAAQAGALPKRAVSSSAKSLQLLQQDVLSCRQCALHKSRTNPVFGEGSPRARLVFVGEAPGQAEDLQGRPFVGRAGELLTKIIKAMGLAREDVYICNVLKCRPPQNRNPLPLEIATCQEYLRQQLSIIDPKIICCLGKFACLVLLKQESAITKLRGSFHDYNGMKVMPTFHPAYLLRNPAAKRLVWEDMQKIMAELRK